LLKQNDQFIKDNQELKLVLKQPEEEKKSDNNIEPVEEKNNFLYALV